MHRHLALEGGGVGMKKLIRLIVNFKLIIQQNSLVNGVFGSWWPSCFAGGTLPISVTKK